MRSGKETPDEKQLRDEKIKQWRRTKGNATTTSSEQGGRLTSVEGEDGIKK